MATEISQSEVQSKVKVCLTYKFYKPQSLYDNICTLVHCDGQCVCENFQSLVACLHAALSQAEELQVQQGPPVTPPPDVTLPNVQQLLIDLTATRDRVRVLERKLTNVCLRHESATESIYRRVEVNGNEAGVQSEVSWSLSPQVRA